MRISLTLASTGDIRLKCLRDKQEHQRIAAPPAPLLVCSSKLELLKRRILRRYAPGYGNISSRNSFCRAAKQRVREYGAALDNTDRSKLLFLTGTLPGSTEQACMRLAAWSGWTVHVLQAWLRRNAPGSHYLGVWEYQKRGALHLHMVVACRSHAIAKYIRARWKARWIALIDGIDKRTLVDMYARKNGGTHRYKKWRTRTDAQVVEKSVANYLGKYLSKGSTIRRSRCQYPPSAWYFASRLLSQRANSLRRQVEVVEVPAQDAESVFEQAAAVIAGDSSKPFFYRPRYDYRGKCIIGLCSPVQGSLIFDYLAGLLRCLLGSNRERDPGERLAPYVVASLFSGRLLTPV